MIGFVWCHGWGAGQSFWKKLPSSFDDHPHIYWNAGYFEPQDTPDLDPSIRWIGVGHSLGFAKLVTSSVPWYKLISLGGFTRFSSEKVDGGISSAVLTTMQKNLRKNPSKTLLDFYAASGFPKEIFSEVIDKDRLHEDLALLKEIDCHETFIEKSIPTLAIASESDPIVPWALTLSSFQSFSHVQLIPIDHPGHGMGYYHAEECKKHIGGFIDDSFRQ